MINFTPQVLSWPDIWNKVEDFRKSKKYAQTFPVEIEELIEFDLKIAIAPIPNLKSDVGVEAYLSKDLKHIFIDNDSFNNANCYGRVRFTLAEEIGHYILHKQIYEEGTAYTSEEEFINDILNMDENDLDWIERQARQFAGRLLVPLDELTKLIDGYKEKVDLLYEKYDGNEEVKNLAIFGFSKSVCDKFSVSWEVIRNRIGYEKLNYKFKR